MPVEPAGNTALLARPDIPCLGRDLGPAGRFSTAHTAPCLARHGLGTAWVGPFRHGTSGPFGHLYRHRSPARGLKVDGAKPRLGGGWVVSRGGNGAGEEAEVGRRESEAQR